MPTMPISPDSEELYVTTGGQRLGGCCGEPAAATLKVSNPELFPEFEVGAQFEVVFARIEG